MNNNKTLTFEDKARVADLIEDIAMDMSVNPDSLDKGKWINTFT